MEEIRLTEIDPFTGELKFTRRAREAFLVLFKDYHFSKVKASKVEPNGSVLDSVWHFPSSPRGSFYWDSWALVDGKLFFGDFFSYRGPDKRLYGKIYRLKSRKAKGSGGRVLIEDVDTLEKAFVPFRYLEYCG